jgi:hypothetical protein
MLGRGSGTVLLRSYDMDASGLRALGAELNARDEPVTANTIMQSASTALAEHEEFSRRLLGVVAIYLKLKQLGGW